MYMNIYTTIFNLHPIYAKMLERFSTIHFPRHLNHQRLLPQELVWIFVIHQFPIYLQFHYVIVDLIVEFHTDCDQYGQMLQVFLLYFDVFATLYAYSLQLDGLSKQFLQFGNKVICTHRRHFVVSRTANAEQLHYKSHFLG